DLLLIAARTSGAREARAGITLFLAPARQPGITLTRTSMLDSRNAALVRLEGVVLDTQHIIGEIDGGSDLLDPVLDRARVGVASEMLGAMSEAFERTLKYLKERVQFGVPIGSFQALKHRAAQMFAEIELTRSAVRAGLRAIDEGLAEAPALASLAKAKAGEAMLLIANEAVQMHGGIGMTDEHEIGFFLKRARVAEASFGNTAFHRDRYAALMGY
ncbi:MAG TPA: acyl-CoA dehydrogenase, partial [Stellaceae bacterium]|nr:acyl-CoA dehydrogenase [Stellaceae bacterium]